MNNLFELNITPCLIERPKSYYMGVGEHFIDSTPHGGDLGMRVEDAHHACATLSIPYQSFLLGDIDRQLIHGGVINSIIDSVSGLSVFCALAEMEAIATLDLRVDHLRPGVAEQTLFAQAYCYRMSEQVAFVRAVAYQDKQRPLATSNSTFMRASSKQDFMKAAKTSQQRQKPTGSEQ